MARMPRLCPAGHPVHVMGRGHNGQVVFQGDSDRIHFLQLIQDNLKRFLVACHAFVLMDNHYHLLLTPERDDSMAQFMRKINKDYSDYHNHKYQRLGSLWQGRYKSSLIQSERYLLACMVYIDLNPMRAGLCIQAEDYPWSSCRHHIGQHTTPWLSIHPLYWQLGNTPFAREAAYQTLLLSGLKPQQQQSLTQAIKSSIALGETQFLTHIQSTTSKRITPSKAGRPFKNS